MKAVRQELVPYSKTLCYAVLDALTEHHLKFRGLARCPLVTGGSGLAIGWPGSGRKKR
ncbi:MAG: hypothetical protein ACLR9W_00840 [Enterobacter hormaechei]